jgi:anti-sigma factor RsiW
MESVHREVVELMPWYVNGSLAADERIRLEKHLNTCLPCRAALRDEQRIRGLVNAIDDVPVGAGHGVADLLRKIDGSGTRATSWWVRPQVGMGVAVVCAAIAGWIVLSLPVAPFTTLTDSASGAVNRIDIVFADAVAATEIPGIVESLGGQLISGPSEIGRYVIAVEVDGDDELFETIERLSGDARIRFVGRNYSSTASADPDIP